MSEVLAFPAAARESKAARAFAPITSQESIDREERRKRLRTLARSIVRGVSNFLLAGVAWTLILAAIGFFYA